MNWKITITPVPARYTAADVMSGKKPPVVELLKPVSHFSFADLDGHVVTVEADAENTLLSALEQFFLIRTSGIFAEYKEKATVTVPRGEGQSVTLKLGDFIDMLREAEMEFWTRRKKQTAKCEPPSVPPAPESNETPAQALTPEKQ